jgi:Tfp pilus assembly ATPase PilU
MFHIIGIEDAVEYIEEHYGPVTNSHPTLTDPK